MMRKDVRLITTALIAAILLDGFFAAWPARSAEAATAYEAFVAQEHQLNAAIAGAADEDAAYAARLALARFYAAEKLHVEALAALGEAGARADDEKARLLVAQSNYALGRFEAAIGGLDDERLAKSAEASALRAMALARIGAYLRAKQEFDTHKTPHVDAAAEFALLKAQTALASGDVASAKDALAAAGGALKSEEFEFVAAKTSLADGDSDARGKLTALAEREGPIAARAAIALLIHDAKARRVGRKEAAGALEAIRLRSAGPEFDRDYLAAAAALAPDEDPAAAIDALRRLAERYPNSDAGVEAERALGGLVSRLAERSDLPPRTIARIFYENIEFAPAGAEGDALIRDLAGRLARLDLLSEAAELLEHQVFNRLRGSERSRVAADLAEIYLNDRRPSEALRVIRATRIAGLDAQTNERRRLLEATALERAGAPAAALELLGAASQGPALDLRADIEWRAREWAAAANSYRLIAANAAAPLDENAKSAVLRAATAYILANDVSGFEAFRREVSMRLGGMPEEALIEKLALQSAGDRANFLSAYRAVFAP